jgi:hypothetical protein
MEIVFIYIILVICGFILLSFVIINDIRALKTNDKDIYKINTDSKKVIKELSKKYKDKNLN